MDFRWEEGGLVWFFLMIFFMLTASPTLLFPTSPFPQNSYVQNKVWPSWKPESSADVPPGKECGLCRSSRGALGRGEAEEGNCKQSWAPPAQAELTLLPLLHGSVTATNTLRVCSHSPYRGQTSHFSSPSRACTGNEFFVLPFFFLFAVGWVSILAHQGISTMSCRESTAREQPWDEERVETELLFSTTSWKISLTVTSAHPQPHRDKVHCIQMHTCSLTASQSCAQCLLRAACHGHRRECHKAEGTLPAEPARYGHGKWCCLGYHELSVC